MKGLRTALIGCVALAGMSVPAWALDGEVTVVGRSGPGLVMPMHQPTPSYELIQISTIHRDVVGVIIHDDAVRPDLVQLQMGNQPIYIDPYQKYGRSTGGIDEGHSILRAQRVHLAQHDEHAYVIRRGETEYVSGRTMITPRAILLRPDLMERRDMQKDRPVAPAPKAPKAKRGPVASAK